MATKVKRRKRKYGEINGEKVQYAGCLRYVNNYIVYTNIGGSQRSKRISIEKYSTDENAKEAAILYATKTKEEKQLVKNGRILKEEYYEFQLRRPKRENRKFHVKNFTNKSEAEKAALNYQIDRSTKLNLNKSMGLATIPIEDQQKMAAWVDGDGCIHIYKSEHPNIQNTFRYNVSVSVGQSCDAEMPYVIKMIKYTYAGKVYTKRGKGNVRKMWQVKIHGNITDLLRSLEKLCVLKYQQATIALACLNETNLSKCEQYYQELKALKKIYETVTIDRSRITIDWIGSFYDAEGTVGVYGRNLTVSYAQESSNALLQAINEFHYARCRKFGTISNGELRYNGRLAAIITDHLLSSTSCISKRPQLELAKKFWVLQCEGKQETEKEREDIEIQIKKLKRL